MSPILRRHWRWVGGRCNGSAVWKTVGERAAPTGGPRREPVALPPGQAQHAGALWQPRGQAASKPRLSSSGSTVTGRWLSAAGRRPTRSATFDATQPRCVFTDDFFGPWTEIEGRGGDRAAAGRHGRAGRLLPPHLRRAPRLGRLPAPWWNSDVCPSGCQSTTSAPTTPSSRKLKPGKAS